MPALTPNAVGRILDNDLELKPTVQCIGELAADVSRTAGTQAHMLGVASQVSRRW